MIRLDGLRARSGYVPGGEAATNLLVAERAADPAAGASTARAFKFSKAIYGPSAVKRTIKQAQFEKCCYCENEFGGAYPGDVEHFRPKARVQQARGAALEYPGYYWLAYRWENLMFACYGCNAMAKRELFPVAFPADRMRTDDAVPAEGAQLIDPRREDPRQHIVYRFIDPHPISPRGATTIEVLKLGRPELRRPRLSHIKYLDALLRLARKPDTPGNVADRVYAEGELNAAVTDAAVFSSMSRDYLAREGWPAALPA